VLLVIFGAGASYDSADPHSSVQSLPLTKDLVGPRFGEIAMDLPASRPIIDRLRARMASDPTVSLETELAKLVDASADAPERRAQLIAFRFYLQRVIEDATTQWMRATRGFTRYLTLLNHLYDWHRATNTPVRLATFNYDTMLETAAQDTLPGWNLNVLPAYIDRQDFRLFKLHGSITWSRAIRGHATAGENTIDKLMQVAERGIPDGDIVHRSPPGAVDVRDPIEILLPALAVPMADKTGFECPDEHLAALEADLPKVKRLLIIGWRAAERHAVELLEGIYPSYALGVVSGSDEDLDEVLANLGMGLTGKARTLINEANGFAGLIANLDAHTDRLLAEW
jgi:hypothetical protein